MQSKNTEIVMDRKAGKYKVYADEFNISGILAAQAWGQINAHLDILNRYKIKLFIELEMLI